MVRKGDVISIVDSTLLGMVKMESVWRIAEVAIQCVEQHGSSRPRMQEIILAIQDAIKIEKGTDKLSSAGSSKGQSSRKTLLLKIILCICLSGYLWLLSVPVFLGNIFRSS